MSPISFEIIYFIIARTSLHAEWDTEFIGMERLDLKIYMKWSLKLSERSS